MPYMVENRRSLHNLVVASKELFVIGDEVDFIEDIDSLWNKFVAIKSNQSISSGKTISTGSKILIV